MTDTPPGAAGRPKLQIDATDLTLAEYGEIEETLGASLEDLLAGVGKWKAVAAMAWIIRRREDPSFTFEDAGAYRMGDIELVAPPDPTVAAVSGIPRPSSLEPGTSIRSA